MFASPLAELLGNIGEAQAQAGHPAQPDERPAGGARPEKEREGDVRGGAIRFDREIAATEYEIDSLI